MEKWLSIILKEEITSIIYIQESCVLGFDRGLCGSVAGKTTLDREVSNTQLIP